MKLKLKIALALGVIAMFITATAFARVGRVGKQDFTLHNNTDVEFHSLHISPHSSDDWEEDILGKDTLGPGESVKIEFDDHEKHGHWDLKVTDKAGDSLEWYDLNLVEISEVTLHWDREKQKGSADIK
jgi:hypothetical protein